MTIGWRLCCCSSRLCSPPLPPLYWYSVSPQPSFHIDILLCDVVHIRSWVSGKWCRQSQHRVFRLSPDTILWERKQRGFLSNWHCNRFCQKHSGGHRGVPPYVSSDCCVTVLWSWRDPSNMANSDGWTRQTVAIENLITCSVQQQCNRISSRDHLPHLQVKVGKIG